MTKEKKTKIAHITPYFYPAICGIGQAVYEIARLQVQAGHKVSVITSDSDKYCKITDRKSQIEGIKIIRKKTWFKISEFMRFWPGVFLEILKSDYDIVHTHGFGHPHCIFASIIAKLKGIKLIHTTHCPWGAGRKGLFAKFFEFLNYNLISRFVLILSNKIIAITPWEFGFIKKYGGKHSKIVNIPNGVADTLLKKIDNNDFRVKYNIDKDKKLILFFGRLNYTKAPDIFLEAGKIVKKSHLNTVFLICGPDEGMKSQILGMIKDNPDFFVIDPITDINEKAKMFQASDIYVLPSRKEGLPLTLFEAMASSLAIVTTNVNGIPFEIKHMENGMLCQPNNATQIAESIMTLLSDSKLKDKMSQNNYKKAKNFTWQIITDRTLQIYQ